MISLTRDCLGWHKGAAAISGTLSNNQKGLSLRICIQRDSPFFLYTIPLPPKKDGLPAIVLAGSPAEHQQSINREHRTHPRPARRRSGDASASRGPGCNPGGSPEGSALWRSPRRGAPRVGVPAAEARVQGRALPRPA